MIEVNSFVVLQLIIPVDTFFTIITHVPIIMQYHHYDMSKQR